ncbi:MAG: hypothetical protein ABIL25_02145 [candidate division WOR-3 bacterium]
MYEILFCDGYQQPPVYYLIDGITGETPEQALKNDLIVVFERACSACG